MPREHTGTLTPPSRRWSLEARVTKTNAGDGRTRPFYTLGTTDKALVRRKLARLVAAIEQGRDLADAPQSGTAPERVPDYVAVWLAKGEAQVVGMVKRERTALEAYVLEAIVPAPLRDVRPWHVHSILDDAVRRRLKRATVAHVRGTLRRVFASVLTDEFVDTSLVVARARAANVEIRKQPTVLTDAELAKFVGCTCAGTGRGKRWGCGLQCATMATAKSSRSHSAARLGGNNAPR